MNSARGAGAIIPFAFPRVRGNLKQRWLPNKNPRQAAYRPKAQPHHLAAGAADAAVAAAGVGDDVPTNPPLRRRLGRRTI